MSAGSDAVLQTIVPYLNLGIIAVLVVMFIKGIGVVPQWVHVRTEQDAAGDLVRLEQAHVRHLADKDEQIDDLRDQVEELKTANRVLLEVYQGRLLPALVENNRLTALYIEHLQGRRS